MPLSTSAKNIIMSNIVGRSYSAFGGTLYLGLSTPHPNEDGTGVTEPSTTDGYSRVLLGTTGASATYKMSAPEDGVSSNTAAILFPRAKASWGTITDAVFFTSETGGTFIGWSPLTQSKAVPTDYVANFDIGSITLSIIDVEPEE